MKTLLAAAIATLLVGCANFPFKAKPYEYQSANPVWYEDGCAPYEDDDAIIVADTCDKKTWAVVTPYIKDGRLDKAAVEARMKAAVQDGVIDEQEAKWLNGMVAAGVFDTASSLFCIKATIFVLLFK